MKGFEIMYNTELPEQYVQLIQELNDTDHELPKEFISQEIQGRISTMKNHIAVITPDKSYSYEELGIAVKQIATFVNSKNIGANDTVAVMFHKGFEQIATAWGIVYHAAAYTPIEYELPILRIQECIETANVKLLLTDKENKERLLKEGIQEFVEIYTFEEACEKANDMEYVEVGIPQPDDVFAVIFTSGSTGKPKGVMVTYENIKNCFAHTKQYYQVTEKTIILSVTNFCHDLSIFDVFCVLSEGGTIVTPDMEKERDPSHWAILIKQNQVNFWNSVPTLANMLVLAAENESISMPSVRNIILGGEFVPTEVVKALRVYCPNAVLDTIGGPTETTIWNINHRVVEQDLQKSVIPYGRPIWNNKFYILNDDLELVNPGEVGIIYNSGKSVTKGYTDEAITAEKYIIHPKWKVRMYNTGDLGSYNQDGYIEIHGRADTQVKINGKRIELEEIESRLNLCDMVAQAAVCVEEKGIYAFCCLKEQFVKEQVVDNWSHIFNETYDEFREEKQSEEEDFSGWFSSYDHTPIPLEQMQEWRNNTINRINRIKGKRIFEVGCGTGLLLHKLAKEAEKFTGIDISDVAIENLRKEIRDAGLKNTEVYCGAADDLGKYKNEKYDTIIINSVILFFDNTEYLLNVIRQCNEMLVDGGCLFIGDVRDYSMMELFNGSVIIYNRGKDDNKRLQERIKNRMAREKELLVSPEFFRDVTNTIPEFNSIMIHSKEAKYNNELTKFRYDVVLYKNRKISNREETVYDLREMTVTNEDILDTLKKGNNVKIIHALHKYVAQEYVQLCDVKGVESGITKKQLDSAVIPYNYYSFACQYGYDCCVETEKNGQMRILIGQEVASDLTDVKEVDTNSLEYTNVPYKELTYDSIANEIIKYVSTYLPDYMLPDYIEVVEKIPQLKNGKIDRKTLSAITREKLEKQDSEEQISSEDLGSYLRGVYKQMLHTEVDENVSFFQMGGHSLLAMQLLNKIRREFQVNIRLSEFMKHSTIKEMEEMIHTLEQNHSQNEKFISEPKKRFESFGLNDMQSSYYFGRSSNVLGEVPTCMYLEFQVENVNIQRMEYALNELVTRHEMLRCVICEENKQIILEHPEEIKLVVEDYSYLTQQQMKEKTDEIFQQVSSTMVDMTTFPAFVFRIVKYGEQYRIYTACDSTFIDGASISVLIRDMYAIYQGNKLKELPISFRDYSIYMEHMEESVEYKECMEYWCSRMESLPEAPMIPVKMEYESAQGKTSVRKEYFINSEKWEKIKKMAQKKQVSLFAVQATAYALVMARWSGMNDFTLNIPIFNRTLIDDSVMDMIGEFGSLIFLEVHVNPKEGFFENCRRIQIQFERDMDYRFVNGARILREFSARGRNLFLPVVLTSLTTPNGKDGIYNQNVELVRWNSQSSQVWIDSIVFDKNGGIELAWDCYPGICREDVLEDMFAAYISCYELLITSEVFCDESVYGLVQGRNQKKILERNNKSVSYGSDTEMLYDGFLKNLHQNPEAVACITKDRSYSYEEIYQAAVATAMQITRNGKEEKRIGILMSKGWKQVAAALGILLAGGTYVPLSKKWPKDRIEKIVKRTQMDTIIIDAIELEEKIATVQYIELKEEMCRESVKEYMIPLEKKPSDAAYIIYTSGSTGEPKGVVIEHRAVINTLYTVNCRNKITKEDRTIMLSELYFDLSVYDIFGAFLSGGAVYIPSEEEKSNPECWSDILIKNKITIWNTVPAIMQMLADITNSKEHKKAVLRHVFLSGDWIPLNLPKRIKMMFKDAQIVSMGGATEASIWSNYYEVQEIKQDWKSIPYGYPMDNQKMYVLDKNGQICPECVPGDICIGGKGLAREYLADEALTKEKFFYHPWLKQRIYMTGDKGVYHEDGAIEFLGRKDNQVKINGFRVELGEIENVALKYTDIETAIAVYRKDIKRIDLYYKSKREVSWQEIKKYLEKKIPTYMMPAAYMQIQQVPVNSNGKVDRKQLPEIIWEVSKESVNEMLTETEMVLKELFEEVIGSNLISVNGDFFQNGGDSLKAVQLLYKMKERMKVSIQLTDIFRNPTIEGLASVIEKGKNEQHKVVHNDIVDKMPLSEAQKGIWFQARSAQQKNMSHIFTLSGSFIVPEAKFNKECFQRAVNQLILLHSELRTEIFEDDYIPYQKYHETLEYHVEHQNYDKETKDVREILEKKSIEKVYNLEQFPLFSFETGTATDGNTVVAIGIHHIISDAYSINVLVRELKDFYHNLESKRENLYTYNDFTVWQNQGLKNGFYAEDIRYWKEKLKDVPSMSFAERELEWGDFEGEEKIISLQRDSFSKLKEICQKNGCTFNSGITTIVGILMHYYFASERVVMGIGCAGRDKPEFKDTVGCFAVISLVDTYMKDEDSFVNVLKRIDAELKESISHATLPFHSYIERGELNMSKASLPTHVLVDCLDTEIDKQQDEFSEFRYSKYVIPAEIVFVAEYLDGSEALRLMYRKNLFQVQDIEEWCETFTEIFYMVTEQPEILLKKVDNNLIGE